MNNQSDFVITAIFRLRESLANKEVLSISNNSNIIKVAKYKDEYKIYLNSKLVFSSKNILHLEKRVTNYINIYNLNTIN